MPDLLPHLADGIDIAETVYMVTPANVSVLATGAGTSHTYGPWAEVIASTSTPIDVLSLEVFQGPALSGTTTAMLCDIGIGPLGSEVVLVGQINVGSLPISSG